ncbi:MAG: hypothetical protein UU22_C0013G0013 [Parcubacteria group bacterium GW2011_GWA2_40_8]|nr:MAG: hypothetical protein UT82_C0008G0018 [Parcubacteria group bacterium GW2011_GWB1_40_14]KKR78778.1 MAG: hypothetical protein UU22_C0013G0013 [Parcubacteria group bacterium GW2011_GWA2_40_8]
MASDSCCKLESPRTALSIIDSFIEDYKFTEKEVAEMISVSVYEHKEFRTLGTLLTGTIRERLIRIRDIIMVQLHQSLSHQGINEWFHAKLRYLKGRTPLELLREDNSSLVYEAASAYADGAYL